MAEINILKSKNKSEVKVKSDHIEFKRAYIRALFLEDERWINCINKYWMIVPGQRLNKLDNRRDLDLKEKLTDQVHPDTYSQRKAYYEAWLKAKCCADDCDRYCDECHGIRFKSVPSRIAREFDVDLRRFIEKYQRFWLKCEQDKALKDIRRGFVYGDGRKFLNKEDSNDTVWDGGRKGIGRSCQFKEDSSHPYQGQKESFLRPGFGGMAFEKSFEYWGR